MTQQTFERALHSWEPWLRSIANGRKALRASGSHPSLSDMRSLAQTSLKQLGFGPCKILELYWLCCIFSEYDKEWVSKRQKVFEFERLVLPQRFPLPYGFRGEQDGSKDFAGKRIWPCEVWTKHDLERQIQLAMRPYGNCVVGREGTRPLDRRGLAEKDVAQTLAEWAIVLPSDHPIHAAVKRGRPTTTETSGLTTVD